MNAKAVLLQSVSAIATTAVAASAATAAHAAAATPATTAPDLLSGYTYSVQGGFLFSAADPTALESLKSYKLGSGSSYPGSGSGFYNNSVFDLKDATSQTGFNGAFTLDKHLDSNWDVGFGASINRLTGNQGSLSFTGSGFYRNTLSGSGGGLSGDSGYSVSGAMTSTSTFGFETMDFEVGYTPTLQGDVSVRLFAGVRALHFNRTVTGDQEGVGNSYGSGFDGSSYNYDYTWFDKASVSSDFFGIGPRVGISGSTRFPGSQFGLSGMVAGAVIIGRQTDTYKDEFGSTYSGGETYKSGYSETVTGNKTVFDAQGQIGVDYYLDDTSKLTVGYQGELLTNVGPIGEPQQNKWVNGAFLKLTGNF